MADRVTYLGPVRAPLGILFPAALLFLAPSIQAQGLYFGGRTGASFATFGGADASRFESFNAGFVLGGVAGYRLSDKFALETEATWIQKGADGILQGFEEPIPISLEMDYLQVPLLGRLNLPRIAQIQPQLLAGGSVSFEMDCDVLSNPSELVFTLGCDEMAAAGVRRSTDWGLVFGTGAAYDLGRAIVVLDGRYDLGLTNLAQPPLSLDLMNRGFSVTVGMTATP